MADKKFVKGGAREVQTQYGSLFNLRIHAKSIAELTKDDEGYVNITMMKIKEPKEHGYTHYFVENTYQRDKNEKQEEQKKKIEETDLPF